MKEREVLFIGCIFLGRLCLSVTFLFQGFYAIWFWDCIKTDVLGSVALWEFYGGKFTFLDTCIYAFYAYESFLVGTSIFLQIFGGLLLGVGFFVRLGAICLLLQLAISTCIDYPFWFFEGSFMHQAFMNFLRNVAIFGGLLLSLSRKP